MKASKCHISLLIHALPCSVGKPFKTTCNEYGDLLYFSVTYTIDLYYFEEVISPLHILVCLSFIYFTTFAYVLYTAVGRQFYA